MIASLQGTILGYDPGGNKLHGVAVIAVSDGVVTKVNTLCCKTAEDVLQLADGIEDLIGVGVDTLSCWSTGQSGWRSADLWLRKKYDSIRKSIVSPNGLYGSMCLNGMSVLISLRQKKKSIPITETHPKVLFWALTRQKYDYEKNALGMDAKLSEWLDAKVCTSTDHEWDAAVSGYASINGIAGIWTHDLLKELELGQARIVSPCGPVNYWWPE
jgi:hypothetical protein